MRILVTGGTGFIGSHIIRRLLKEKHDVVTTGMANEQQVPPVRIYFPAYFTEIDWSKHGTFDIVFHQAAINETQSLDYEQMFKVNVDESIKLFKAVVANGCKRIVYASSTAVYGNAQTPFKEDTELRPLTFYGDSKKHLDELAMAFARDNSGICIAGLRYCNVYGPGESHKGKRASMIYQLAQQMLNQNPKLFKWGHHKRDFIYIDDIVEANLLAANAKESCIVNCGTGRAISFNEIVNLLNKTLGTNRNPAYIDNPNEGRYQNFTKCDMTLAKQKIGFVPRYSTEEGIRKYYESKLLTRN